MMLLQNPSFSHFSYNLRQYNEILMNLWYWLGPGMMASYLFWSRHIILNIWSWNSLLERWFILTEDFPPVFFKANFAEIGFPWRDIKRKKSNIEEPSSLHLSTNNGKSISILMNGTDPPISPWVYNLKRINGYAVNWLFYAPLKQTKLYSFPIFF